ncbi:MAG: HAD family hydrolase [Candidatus Hodarchaeota archaeon]
MGNGKKLAIFDMDGTICEFVLDWKNARLEVIDYLVSLGIPVSVLNIKNSILDLFANAREFFKNKAEHVPDWTHTTEVISEIVDRYEKEAAKVAKPIQGVREVLVDLKSRGVLLAICTLNSTNTATGVLEKHDLLGFFDIVVGRDLVKNTPKPNPEHGSYILKQLDVRPENSCMIGDHPADMEMAESLGISGVAILSKRHGIDEFTRFKGIKTIRDDSYHLALASLIMESLDMS